MQPQATPDVVWISAPQVRARYGNRSAMWLVRKLDDPDFPRPVYFDRLKFFKLSEIEAYERIVIARGKPSAPKQPDNKNTKKKSTKKAREAA
jgi:hypothetical protein